MLKKNAFLDDFKEKRAPKQRDDFPGRLWIKKNTPRATWDKEKRPPGRL